MNYRHLYHAGNFADVSKHVILVGLLRQLMVKPKGICYLDSHAGLGVYDLTSEQAQKTAEYRDGIERLLAADGLPPLLQEYLALVRAANPAGGLQRYPGSPELARQLLRPQDRAVLFELQPEDAASLRARYRDSRRVAVHHADGYQAVRAFLPPPEGRGLLLVDPPFEAGNEFGRMQELLLAAQRAWRGGILSFWYPLKDRAATEGFHRGLAASGVRKILRAELAVLPEDVPGRLNGSGMIIVNPPWRFEQTLREVLPALAAALAPAEAPAPRVDWLVPE